MHLAWKWVSGQKPRVMTGGVRPSLQGPTTPPEWSALVSRDPEASLSEGPLLQALLWAGPNSCTKALRSCSWKWGPQASER